MNEQVQDSKVETKNIIRKQKMQHPPRPQARSSKIIPIAGIRKTMTPNMLQEQNQQFKNQESRSMRETIASISNGIHQSLNHIDNVEYLEISKLNYGSSANMTFDKYKSNNIINCSFKIRNFGCIKSKVKQNTIPLKLKAKPIITTKPLFQDNSLVQTQGIQFLKLQNYPENLHLHCIGAKIGHVLLTQDKFEANQEKGCENWAFIISQSIFYGEITSQTNLLKLKYLVEIIKKQCAGMKVILKLYSYRHSSSIINKLKQRQIRITGVIWSKNKHYQTVNCINLTDIVPILQTNRYIVIEDTHQVIKNIYYQTYHYGINQNHMNTQNYDNNKEVHIQKKAGTNEQRIDNRCRYLYLKIQGLASFVKFCQKLKIFESADELCVQKSNYKNVTEEIIQVEQLFEKIKIFKQRKFSMLPRPKYQIKQNKINQSISYNNSKQEQLRELKNKILQCLQNIHERSRKDRKEKKSKEKEINRSSKSLKKKGQPYADKIVKHPYEGLLENFICETNKTYMQLIQQITKNNLVISKQINKFRQKTMEVFIQQFK